MAKKAESATAAPAVKKGKPPKVWVCRGCCCGTLRRHPGVDHDVLLERAKAGAREAGAKFEVTDCLGPCGQGNIVVVRAAGRIRWFGGMNDERSTGALLAHLRGRGSLSDLPEGLRRRVLRKSDGRKP